MKSFMNLGPCFPYLIRAGNTFTPGDFDGDGRVEVASFCPTNTSLNILSYFTYAEQNSAWINATSPQLVNAWACAGSVPAASQSGTSWTLQAGDSYLRIRLKGATSAGVRPADSLIVFRPGPPDTWQSQLGVLQWTGQQMQTMFVSDVGVLAPGTPGINANDTLVAADIDGDGWEELIIYSPDDQWVFTVRWTGTTFELISKQQDKVGTHWPIGHNDIYFAGCRIQRGEQSGQDQVVAFNPQSLLVSLLYYYEQGVFASSPVYYIPAQSSNPSIFAANLEGEGRRQLVVYGNANDLMYVQWLWYSESFFSTSPPTGIVKTGDVLVPANLAGTGHDYLFKFNGTDCSAAVYSVPNFTSLEPEWSSTDNTISGAGLNPNVQFYVADVDGDGCDELIMFSPDDEFVFTIKWDGSRLWVRTVARTQILGWSVELLTNPPVPTAPMAPQPFQGNQLQIYTNASQNYLYPAVASSLNGQGSATDIRSCYQYLQAYDFESLQNALSTFVKGRSRSDDLDAVAGALSIEFIYGYISDVLGAKSEVNVGANIRGQYTVQTTGVDFSNCAQWLLSIPMLKGANPDAWMAMQRQLFDELSVIKSVNEWYQVMWNLNQNLENVNTGAFETTSTNVNQTTAPLVNSSASFWVAAIIGAGIWGAAAMTLEDEPEYQIALAVVASLYGSVTGSLGSVNATPPAPVPYDEFSQLVTQPFLDQQGTINGLLNQIASDRVLLPMLGGLFAGTPENTLWTWTGDQLTDVTNAATNPTSLADYAALIPMRFNILIWPRATQSGPYYCIVYEFEGMPYYYAMSCNAPSNAYQAVSNGDDTWTIYLLCGGSDPSQISGYPGQDMFDDLENNLGVQLSDILQGNGPWANIPRVTLNLNC